MHFYFAAGNYIITIIRRTGMLWGGTETVSFLCVMYWTVDCRLIWINTRLWINSTLYWQFIVLVM